MRASRVTIILLAVVAVGSSLSRSRVIEDSNSKAECKSIEEIPMCAGLGYEAFALPNILKQDSISQINTELSALIGATQCSNALVYFLCSLYAPFCFNMHFNGENVAQTLSPCRNLCLYVREGCIDDIQRLELSHLNCAEYPDGGLCFGPSNFSIFDPIEVHTKEETICDYEVTEIQTTSAAIISSNTTPQDAITCIPAVLHITVGETIQLTGLKPETRYICTIQQGEHTCTVELTTLPLLSIQLINSTPDVYNNSIHLEFETNRAVATLQCQLLPIDNKINCSGGTVDFEGVDPGHHTIRILAENSADDRATIRVRARVLKPGHCTVTLINQQWALEEGVLTVWFKGHPKQDSFDCKVADEFECHVHTDTADPPSLTATIALTEGTHTIQISPKKSGNECTRRYPRKITVTV